MVVYQRQQSKKNRKSLMGTGKEQQAACFQIGSELKALRNLQEPYHFVVYWHARTRRRVNKLLTDKKIFSHQMKSQHGFQNLNHCFKNACDKFLPDASVSLIKYTPLRKLSMLIVNASVNG